MRKSILGLVAIGAVAAPIAFASSANAVVAVTDGTGFVGKGDVQTALGYGNGNDKALQQDIKEGDIKFLTASSPIRSTVAHGVQYALLVDGKPDMTNVIVVDQINLGHAAYTANGVVKAEAKGTTGKVTGWNLTGVTGVFDGTATTVPSTMNYARVYEAPAGRTFVGYVDEDTALTSETTLGEIVVTNGTDTAVLSNTPAL